MSWCLGGRDEVTMGGVGVWEGEAFVVQTTGFRDGGGLDTRKGRPHRDALRVTERYRRVPPATELPSPSLR